MPDWVKQNEYAVVGALLEDQHDIGEVAEKLKPDAFSVELLRTVYQEIIRLHFSDEPVSAASVLNAIGSDYEPIIKQALEFSAFARSDLPFYAGVLMEQSRLGQVRHAAAELAASETMDAANDAMAALNGLMVTKSSVQVVDSGEAAADFFARLGSSPEYLKWNIPDIDAKVYAEPGDLILLGGYPSSGKTLLAVQLALSMSRTYRVGFFSLETSARKLTDRIMSHLSQVPLAKIKRRDLNEAEWAALADASTKFDALPFSIVPAAGFSVHDIQAVARNRKFQIIFVDYLQIINEKGKDRFDKVSNISLVCTPFRRRARSRWSPSRSSAGRKRSLANRSRPRWPPSARAARSSRMPTWRLSSIPAPRTTTRARASSRSRRTRRAKRRRSSWTSTARRRPCAYTRKRAASTTVRCIKP